MLPRLNNQTQWSVVHKPAPVWRLFMKVIQRAFTHVTDADMQPLNDDDLEDVAGGELGGSGDSCNHNFVYTGAEKDESYYIFWTAHYKEKKCTKCGQYRWEKVDWDRGVIAIGW